MAYFDFFMKNVENRTRNPTDVIQGTCYAMCPDEESALREKENLIHVLEIKCGEKNLVKSYGRSSASTKMAHPRLLRPYPVLKNTVQHLLLEVTNRKDVPINIVYDFVNDRLRAVRQDMIIQRLSPENCVDLLEPMVRFYVYFGYKLRQCQIRDFDPVLNKKHLLESMKWYLNCCDIIDHQKHDLNYLMSIIDIHNTETLSNDRILVESLYILSNMDDTCPLVRYLTLPKEIKSNKKLKLAYDIAMSNMSSNYVRTGRLVAYLCPLTYCAVSWHLPRLRRRALKIMSAAYNSKQLSVPRDVISKWLLLNSEDVDSTCAHYGIQADGDKVKFSKGSFKHDSDIIESPNSSCLFNKVDEDLLYIFTYKDK